MERSKLIDILENGSESELTLIQNYILDRVLKNMPTEKEAVDRAIEDSKTIRELERKVLELEARLAYVYGALSGGTDTTSWNSSPKTYGYEYTVGPQSTCCNNTAGIITTITT